MSQNLLDKIVSLAKRRGFIFPSSEIYGGLANNYDYGPLGVLLKRNIEKDWWDFFVTKRPEIFGLDTGILMNPRVWQASGHTQSFVDALIDCKSCQRRMRADHLIEDTLNIKVEGKKLTELDKIIKDNQLKCPTCGNCNWTPARKFNLLFETYVGIVPENQSKVYLRGETAQGMFVDFKHVLDSLHPQLPFGLAQSGIAFRNEITKGQSIFRTLEFHLAEFEYYIKEAEWRKWFDYWKNQVQIWVESLGIDKGKTRWRQHGKEELSHYSRRTEDLEYNYPFGFKEWCAVAYRTDFDLKNHMEKSGVDLRYTDPQTQEKFIPHVIEPTFGITRTLLAILLDAYTEADDRVILKIKPKLAPYKVAVFPLLANKPDLISKAKSVFEMLLANNLSVTWDDRGNIGKRYLSQDEVGTPWCVTIDFVTLEADTVTIRDRDTKKQKRLNISQLVDYFQNKLK